MDARTPHTRFTDDEERTREASASRRIPAGSLRALRQRERAGLEALAQRVSALRARQRALRR